MKRLGLYVIISIMLFGVFGGFVHPEKSYAQTVVTQKPLMQEDKDTIQSDAVKLLEEVHMYTDLPSAIRLTFKTNLYVIINDYFTNYFKYTPPAKIVSKDFAEAEIYSSFSKYLKDYESGSFTGKTLLMAGPVIVTNASVTFEKEAIDLYTLDKQKRGEITQSERATIVTNATAAAVKTVNDKIKKVTTGCSFISWSISSCISDGFEWFIKSLWLEVAGFLVWLTANMLNMTINVGILNFSDWAPKTLYPIWVTIRQIVSLFVVFAGLFLGFMYIIGRDDKFKKYLPWVVIFALFVNFSYPISRSLIDVSNLISLNIYKNAIGIDPSNTAGGDTAGAKIMNSMGLQGLVMSATGGKEQGDLLGSINSVPGALMAVIFVLYAAWVFFIATAILATRTAVLVFLIIASPFLFVDSVIPKLGDVAVKLRKMYFEQLAVAPVFMIMLALTLKFLEVFNGSGALKAQTNTLASSAQGTSDISVFFNIFMMLIMLHIMLKVTKSVSGSAGQMASNFMGKVGGFAVGGAAGMALGGAGVLARGTLGKAATGLRDSEWVTNNQHTFAGRMAHGMTNSVASSSFDARNSSFVQAGAEKIGLGKGMGGGTKTNYDAESKARVAARAERYGRIKTENEDGTLNLAGIKAKADFYNAGGGGVFDKDKTKKALAEADKKEAENREAKLEAYRKSVGEGRQRRLDKEESPSMRNQMLEQDKMAAEKDNAVENYKKMNDQERRVFYNDANQEMRERLKALDEELAMTTKSFVEAEGKARQDIYKKATEEQKKVFLDQDASLAYQTEKERPIDYKPVAPHENYTLAPAGSDLTQGRHDNSIDYEKVPFAEQMKIKKSGTGANTEPAENKPANNNSYRETA